MRGDTPIARQWKLLRMLGCRRLGLTIQEMSTETGVGIKTIRRDLDFFRGLGFPLTEHVCERGLKRWRLAGAHVEPPLAFRLDEAIALYLGRHLMDPLAGTPLWDAAQSSFRKIKATLGEKALEYIESFRGFYHQTSVGTSSYAAKAEVIDAIMVALEDRKAVHIAYQSLRATEPATRDIYPYGFIYHRGSLYLAAFAPEHDRVKTYKVDRVESVEVSNRRFERPADFDLDRFLSGSFGVFEGEGDLLTVCVRFAPCVSRYVREAHWHSSQELTPQTDGSLLARFHLNSLEEFRAWILGFGSNALVLQPTSLRTEIAAEVGLMLRMYGQEVGAGDDMKAFDDGNQVRSVPADK